MRYRNDLQVMGTSFGAQPQVAKEFHRLDVGDNVLYQNLCITADDVSEADFWGVSEILLVR
ncbi:MAG: hypothetical protein WB729_06195 [Candidatus Sulfotelmatobacter sp.]